MINCTMCGKMYLPEMLYDTLEYENVCPFCLPNVIMLKSDDLNDVGKLIKDVEYGLL
jgi:hypothetical protein